MSVRPATSSSEEKMAPVQHPGHERKVSQMQYDIFRSAEDSGTLQPLPRATHFCNTICFLVQTDGQELCLELFEEAEAKSVFREYPALLTRAYFTAISKLVEKGHHALAKNLHDSCVRHNWPIEESSKKGADEILKSAGIHTN